MIQRKNNQCLSLDINKRIQACQKCPLASLECNIKDVKKGTGKLYGWRGGSSPIRFFFIGMNPSHNRFENLEYAFGGRDFDEGTGVEFVNILKMIGILEVSCVDNIVHCSTEDNKIDDSHILNCLPFLRQEFDLHTPEKFIALGNQVHEALVQHFEPEEQKKLVKVWHPNYVISRNPGLMGEYIRKIKAICQ